MRKSRAALERLKIGKYIEYLKHVTSEYFTSSSLTSTAG